MVPRNISNDLVITVITINKGNSYDIISLIKGEHFEHAICMCLSDNKPLGFHMIYQRCWVTQIPHYDWDEP